MRLFTAADESVLVSGKREAHGTVFAVSCHSEYPPANPARHHPLDTIARHIARLLTGGLLIVSASFAHATAPVGATPGTFAVSPSGAASYSIPIVVPPGVNGMQPNLLLVYNSQSGNGLLGMGWSIGGLSVIHRCGATIYLDGFKGGVNYDANDRFCLDGERLIIGNGGVYGTQHESWQKIVAVGGTASDPSYFTVTSRDGTIRYYGATTDSHIEVQGKTVARLWALNKIQDRNGNYLTITYSEDNTNGDYRPTSVAYSGNTSSGVLPYNTVNFEYGARTDLVPQYEGGSLVQSTQRLTRITANAGASLVREYRLNYDYNGVVGRSRLTSIQECGSDGVCLPATTFGWQGGDTGYTNATWTGQAYTPNNYSSVHFGELNGDGKADGVVLTAQPSYYASYYISLSTGTGYSNISWNPWPVSNWIDGPFYGDVNGDGVEDFVLFDSVGSYPFVDYYIALSTSGGGRVNQAWKGWLNSGSQSADLNGDGLADYVTINGGTHYVSLSTGTGFTNQQWSGCGIADGAHFADLNGDGKMDYVTVSGGTHCVSLSTGTGYVNQSWTGQPISDSGMYFADVNGDGKADAITVSTTGVHYVSLSTGKGYVNQQWTGRPLSDSGARFTDLNGDGKMDYVSVAANGMLYISLSTGTGYINTTWQGAPLSSSGAQFADLNGDGMDDYVTVSTSGQHYISLSNGPFPDLLTSITNGLGVQTNVTYKPLTDSSVYTKDSGSTYPYVDIQNPMYVVSQVTQSNGVGGFNSSNYLYGGLKSHQHAAASLGLRWMQTTDPAGIVSVTYYNQTLDGTEGTVATNETWASGVRVKYVGNTWTPVALGGGTTLAQLASSIEETRELNNSVVTTVNATYSGYDAYGNPGTIVVNYAVGGVSDGWTKTTNNTYNNDTVNWQLGQLLQSQVTGNAPSQIAQTRTSSFTYDALGRLASEVIEPNNATLKLTTAYGYDSFGNRTSATVSGSDIVTRTTSQGYDTRGQLVTSRTNALGHIERFENLHPAGALTKYTDINNLVTTSTYDGFGRKIGETRPDGTITTITYGAWSGGIYAQTITTGAGENYVYSDILGRVVQTNTQGFGGNWIYKKTYYDSLSRVAKVSHPYFASETQHCTTYSYDVLGRVRTVTEPGPTTTDCDNTSGGRVTTTTYNGLSATVTNPLSQQRITVKNSQGLVATTTDNAGTTTHTYDPFGNLKTVTAVDGVMTTMGYDDRGRKTSMNDPDMGAWTYGYNVFGELLWLRDAKLQTINMTYDVLGRMKTRVLPNGEGTATWNYDTAINGKGKLASVSNPSATETYTYDNLSRVGSVTASISGITYTTTYAYDAYSRVDAITYPTVTVTATSFILKHIYDPYGYLTEVRKDNATGLRYWQATNFDAHGRLTKETFGNNLISERAYLHETDDLQFIKTGPTASPTSVQNSTFAFDALDNLTARNWWDGTATRSETFGYDTLNRLAKVTGPANKTNAYFPNGNIQSKSDVGTYSYPANGIRPHAVTSVAGTVNTSFTYDANGNLLSSTPVVGANVLQSGVPTPPLAAAQGAELRYTFTVPAGMNFVSVQLTGNDLDDADLYVKFGSPPTLTSYDCASEFEDSDEACRLATPSAGTYHVLVSAYTALHDVQILATAASSTSSGGTLTNALPTGDLAAASGTELRYTFTVPTGANFLSFQLTGGTGDADLYAKLGSPPTTASYDCAAEFGEANEACELTPAAGTYHVLVNAYTAFAGVRLLAVYSTPGAGDGNTARTLTYTAFNKPQTIAQGSTTSTLTYDAHYNRLIKVAPGGTTTYLGKLYEKLESGSTTTQKHYIYAGHNLIGAYTSVSNNTTNTRYFHTDHLGSVEVITDETGSVVQRLSYDALGKRRNVNGTDASSITAQTPRGFTRHEHDDEVGLVNMNAREYDPLLGRFITPDTIVPGALNSQAYNRYSYAYNNPLSFTDPSGQWSLRKAVRKITNTLHRVGERIHIDTAYRAYARYQVASAYVAAGFYMGGPTGAIAGARAFYESNKVYNAGGNTGDTLKTGAANGVGTYFALEGVSGMYDSWINGIVQTQSATLATAKVAGQQYVNAQFRDAVGNYAARQGYSLTEFNLGLFGFSVLGNGIAGSRLKSGIWDNTEWGIRGFGQRTNPIIGLPFDVVDTVLAYQGLPTASAVQYVFSSQRGIPLTGHSLGALDVANLSGFGLAGTSSRVYALPFGKVASGTGVTIGSGDVINGFGLGTLFNPDAAVVDTGFFGHGCRLYPGCGQ